MGRALRGDRLKNNLILWVTRSLFQLLKSQGFMVGVVITSNDGVSFHMGWNCSLELDTIIFFLRAHERTMLCCELIWSR